MQVTFICYLLRRYCCGHSAYHVDIIVFVEIFQSIKKIFWLGLCTKTNNIRNRNGQPILILPTSELIAFEYLIRSSNPHGYPFPTKQ